MRINKTFLRLFLGNLLVMAAVTALVGIIIYTRLAEPVKTVAGDELFLRQAILWGCVTGIAAAALVGFLVNWIWYAPLRKLTLAATRISSGDLSKKVRIGGGGELAKLAKSLNEMRQGLADQVNMLAAQGQNLQAVLSNVREGIIAADSQGRVVLMNQAAGAVFSTDPARAAGKKLQTAVPVLEVLNFYNSVQDSDRPISGQFEIQTSAGRRTFDINGIKIAGGPSDIRCILVLWDITELASAAVMKSQFVANASHELRTPLATIRAAVDSLASAEADNHDEVKKLGGVLDRHVGRLEDLINDLLDLHMAESDRFPLRIADMKIDEIVQWINAQFSAHAQSKGLALEVSSCGPGQHFASDRKLLELIVRNLIDNSIKFTPSGGRVKCSLEIKDNNICICVSDTGCGIKKADQLRIFERFFQSDSARSGDTKVRGTGLGLAIVKHAAERLNAKILMESSLGTGTTMTVQVPAKHRPESQE